MIGDKHEADIKNRLAEKMAGEITLSEKPGEVMKKWRVNFDVAQSDLSSHLEVSPSVISDYESGRRKSPGTVIVSKIVNALLEIDRQRGSKKIHAYESMVSVSYDPNIIYDIHEYTTPMSLDELSTLIDARFIYRPISESEKQIYGYTIIDSLKAILDMPFYEFQKLYGWSTERALIFTGISTGRSPMVAIRVTNLKPRVIVLHGLDGNEVDPVAKKIAQAENIPLMSTNMSIESIIKALQERKV
ncbi:MAG: transcriptional regulator [ANME-2 cluster archaeon]|nr:transcriptional regulator [ANME-2 cluster archaeon]MCL7474884.1 transcriptional regulator [ANME-2 cluster archaeon]MDF1531963.1 transcriptional regulator [ANME-2 cluster archaeon]MDW7775437.1 transcriptional regulator [Methanosarcinales archaeon]